MTITEFNKIDERMAEIEAESEIYEERLDADREDREAEAKLKALIEEHHALMRKVL